MENHINCWNCAMRRMTHELYTHSNVCGSAHTLNLQWKSVGKFLEYVIKLHFTRKMNTTCSIDRCRRRRRHAILYIDVDVHELVRTNITHRHMIYFCISQTHFISFSFEISFVRISYFEDSWWVQYSNISQIFCLIVFRGRTPSRSRLHSPN